MRAKHIPKRKPADPPMLRVNSRGKIVLIENSKREFTMPQYMRGKDVRVIEHSQLLALYNELKRLRDENAFLASLNISA